LHKEVKYPENEAHFEGIILTFLVMHQSWTELFKQFVYHMVDWRGLAVKHMWLKAMASLKTEHRTRRIN